MKIMKKKNKFINRSTEAKKHLKEGDTKKVIYFVKIFSSKFGERKENFENKQDNTRKPLKANRCSES